MLMNGSSSGVLPDEDRLRAWVRGLGKDDELEADAAFTRLYGGCVRALCRYGSRVIGCPDAAQDVVDEVFHRALEAAGCPADPGTRRGLPSRRGEERVPQAP
jgi:hypothetical protein